MTTSRSYRDIDPALIEVAWSFYEREQAKLRTMCRNVLRGSNVTVEEGMSEIAYQLPGVLACFDSSRGVLLRTHVFTSCRWYVYKLRDKRKFKHRHMERSANETLHEVPDFHRSEWLDDDLFDHEEVQSLLDRLASINAHYASVLRLYFLCELTYEQIGDILGFSKNTARCKVQRAISLIKAPIMTIRCQVCHSVMDVSSDAELAATLDVKCNRCGVLHRVVSVPMRNDEPPKSTPPLAFATVGRTRADLRDIGDE